MVNIEACQKYQHLVFDLGDIWFCYVCHMRTDSAFAVHSKALLAKVKQAA